MERKNIEIPFGAFDSELGGFEYAIPEGYEAEIKDGKVVVKKKESKDEGTRKWLMEMVEELRKANPTNADHNGSCSDAIAWLEKQGEQKPVVIIPKFRVGDVIHLKNSCAEYTIKSISDGHYYGDGFSFNIVGCDRDYELVKQKPTNKVETKFKVCDKIRRKTPSSYDKDMQVARIEKDYYICNHIGKFSSEVVPFSEESSYELIEQKPTAWHGKQGEPTEINSEFDSQLNRLLEKFKSLPKEELASSLSFYLNVVQNDGTYKDEEKQGEQKVEVKYVYTKFRIGDVIVEIKPNGYCQPVTVKYIGEWAYSCESDDGKRSLSFPIISQDEYKLVEQKPAWSEEDKKMSRFIGNAITADGASEYLESKGIQVIDAHVWLDELKDRVQPQNTWKPSDEQMRELGVVATGKGLFSKEILRGLLEQLKKLREE